MQVRAKLSLGAAVFGTMIAFFSLHAYMQVNAIMSASKHIREATSVSQAALDFNVENFHTQLEIWEYALEPSQVRLLAFESHRNTLEKLLDDLLEVSSQASFNAVTMNGRYQISVISENLAAVKQDWAELIDVIGRLDKATENGQARDDEKQYVQLRARTLKRLNMSEDLFDRLVFNTTVDKLVAGQKAIVLTLTEEQEKAVSDFVVVLSIEILLLIAFGILVSTSLSNSITKPLSKIRKSIEQTGSGNLEHRIRIDSSDEFGVLAQSLNRMSSDLSASTTSIETLNREIAEHKQSAKLLEDSERKSRAWLDNSIVCTKVVDIDFNLQYMSKAGVEALKIDDIEEFYGKTYPFDFYPESFRIPMTANLTKAKETSEVITQEAFVVDTEGNELWYHSTIVPVTGDSGKIDYIMILSVETTETRRLQALESRAQRLETAGIIAGQVAHDFNNLLAPLMGLPELIRPKLPKASPAQEYLDLIEQASYKIANINKDLLAMGRRGHFDQKPLSLNTVIQQCLNEPAPLPETLEIDTNLDEGLLDILGSGAQLHRLVSNLIHNARDAMHNKGKGKNKLSIRTENFHVAARSAVVNGAPEGDYVKLTISDTGCGIPDDIVDKIFNPFFTSKETNQSRGSGLGMSVVDAVIKDHGGYINLDTKVGEGTTFHLYFPITLREEELSTTKSIRGGNETILVVDDDEIQLQVSSQLLTSLGYDVTTVNSGERAIEFLRNNPRDLVVIDMVMPGGIDGAETYRRFLQICPKQKAIIMSGFSETESIHQAHKLGLGRFVMKPITKKIIATAVRSELDKVERILV